MCTEEKKAWLSRGLSAKRKAETLFLELQRISGKYYKAHSYDSPTVTTKGSFNSDLSSMMAKIETIEHRYLNTLKAEHDSYISIMNAIEGSDLDADIKAVFFQRYIDGKTWQEIADDMEMSFRHVTRLHGQGLKVFEIPQEKETPNEEINSSRRSENQSRSYSGEGK